MLVVGDVFSAAGGLERLAEDIPLAVFTTFTPAAAVSYAILAVCLLVGHPFADREEQLDHMLVLPLALAMFGLVFATVHLGRPANSLYVLTGIGRSPLSNEIWASVIFVGCAWLRWFLGFSQRQLSRVKPALLVVCILAAGAQVWFTAGAYSINTVITWDLPFTRINQICSAVVGGCVLTFVVLAAAQHHYKGFPVDKATGLLRALLIIAVLASAGLLAGQIMQYRALSGLHSTLVQAADMASMYPAVMAVFSVCMVAALAVLGTALRHGARLTLWKTILACSVALIGLFAVRVMFYALYLTAGL